MKNHVMVCPPPQNQNEVVKPSGSWQHPPPHFLRTLGGISRHVCPVTAGRKGNFAGQRPQTAYSISCAGLARSVNVLYSCSLEETVITKGHVTTANTRAHARTHTVLGLMRTSSRLVTFLLF